MRLIMNSEPVVHRHICDSSRVGQVMTEQEILDFAILTLKNEYECTKDRVEFVNKINGLEADLSLFNGDKKINIKVIVSSEKRIDLSKIDKTWMFGEFLKNGAIPRLVIADYWCFDDSSVDGKPAICGAEFCFKYYPISLIPNERNFVFRKELTSLQLVERYAEAWRRLDYTIVEPYLDKDFHYGSDWVFDELPSRYEYLDYLEGKFNAIKKSQSAILVEIAKHVDVDKCALVLTQDGLKSVLYVRTNNGRIVSAQMSDFDSTFELMYDIL